MPVIKIPAHTKKNGTKVRAHIRKTGYHQAIARGAKLLKGYPKGGVPLKGTYESDDLYKSRDKVQSMHDAMRKHPQWREQMRYQTPAFKRKKQRLQQAIMKHNKRFGDSLK